MLSPDDADVGRQLRTKVLYAAGRRAILEEVRGAAVAIPGTTAATSQDFLYDEYGIPQ